MRPLSHFLQFLCSINPATTFAVDELDGFPAIIQLLPAYFCVLDIFRSQNEK
jgi:hypothetical protein